MAAALLGYRCPGMGLCPAPWPLEDPVSFALFRDANDTPAPA